MLDTQLPPDSPLQFKESHISPRERGLGRQVVLLKQVVQILDRERRQLIDEIATLRQEIK